MLKVILYSLRCTRLTFAKFRENLIQFIVLDYYDEPDDTQKSKIRVDSAL
jgi:hypothetical protein